MNFNKNIFSKIKSGWSFVIEVFWKWYKGGIGDLAAGVTFWILISLPAFVLAMLAILGPIDNLLNFSFQTTIEKNAQEFVAGVFVDESGSVQNAVSALFARSNPSLFTVSILFAFWSISRGFAGLIRSLDYIYEIQDTRPWYYARIAGLILGIGTMLIGLPLVLFEQLIWVNISDGLIKDLGRYLAIFATLVAWATIIFYFGPAKKNRLKEVWPGALVAALLWCLLYFGFNIFVSFSSGANQVRAVVGAGLLVLTWLWFAAQALLIGGSVNHLYFLDHNEKNNVKA